MENNNKEQESEVRKSALNFAESLSAGAHENRTDIHFSEDSLVSWLVDFAMNWLPAPPPSIEGKQDAAIGGNCTLEELDAGSLFKHGDTIGLKTEYREDNGAIDAYIVGTGEMFWGGTNNPEDQRKIIVEVYNLKRE